MYDGLTESNELLQNTVTVSKKGSTDVRVCSGINKGLDDRVFRLLFNRFYVSPLDPIYSWSLF